MTQTRKQPKRKLYASEKPGAILWPQYGPPPPAEVLRAAGLFERCGRMFAYMAYQRELRDAESAAKAAEEQESKDAT